MEMVSYDLCLRIKGGRQGETWELPGPIWSETFRIMAYTATFPQILHKALQNGGKNNGNYHIPLDKL